MPLDMELFPIMNDEVMDIGFKKFLSKSLRHYVAETFLASLTFTRLAKNPLFEVISPLIPTGPPKIKKRSKNGSNFC
jgi:hypothetical protein